MWRWLRKLFYRDVPASDYRVRMWRMQARAAMLERDPGKQWPMLRRIQ